jgi:hypothetical protein
MTPADYFALAFRSPPPAISQATRPVSVCAPRCAPPPRRDIYTLRRQGAPPMFLTQELLACFFDLTVRQAGIALQTCDTAIKRLRLWSRQPSWPCREVRLRAHPSLTFESIRTSRQRQLASAALRAQQPDLHAALLRAEELVVNPDRYAGPGGFPSAWLDGLDAPEERAVSPPAPGPRGGSVSGDDAPAAPPAVTGGPAADEADAAALLAWPGLEDQLGWFDACANPFESACDDPLWAELAQ